MLDISLGHGRRKGEFASLPHHEAALRLTAARRALGVAWVLRRGGPVRIHVRAKDLRRPGRTDSVLAAIDTALGRVTPTTYGRHTRRGGLTRNRQRLVGGRLPR